MRRHRRYLHRRFLRFPYILRRYYGKDAPWWPHRLSDRIDNLEIMRKYHREKFDQRINGAVRVSITKRYGDALTAGTLSEDAFNRKLSLLQAARKMREELSIFANMQIRTEWRCLYRLCVLERAFRKLNPYLKCYTEKSRLSFTKETLFDDPVLLKEMLMKMQREPLMESRRRILMSYANDGWNYNVDYGKVWKMDAAYFRKKRCELASRHTESELEDLESVLLAPYIHMHTASLSPVELVFLFAHELKMDIDTAKKLVKFGRSYGYYLFSVEKQYVLADPEILKRYPAQRNKPFAVPCSVMNIIDADLQSKVSGTNMDKDRE